MRAYPGDVVTVHEGIYRERINPPRGGTSDEQRIVYQAALNEEVVIKGSESVSGWCHIQNDTWELILPDGYFGEFNPFKDRIRGDWYIRKDRTLHTGAVYLNGHWLTEAASLEDVMLPAGVEPLWFTPSESAAEETDTTTIWAQFNDINPNQADVEINVRQSVFYPQQTGVNFITVRGFTMMHAATNWAPPTAEQIGLIGTHWSKGWVIEDNDIRYSTCTGVTLGKHGDQWDNTSANSAEGYVKTIERGLENGWSQENIGHHVVRNNSISHCEQAGIVGSLGAAFSTISGNTIHDIHVRRLFTGHEMAAIKFHAPLDSVISHNHIYRCSRGIWLDWMTQGTRVTGNLLHDNGPREDMFMEVNHGPFTVDNNVCLSANSLLINSQGGAYVHNLFSGNIRVIHSEGRLTPANQPHSTALAGLHPNPSGDDRYYNNIFAAGNGLAPYDAAKLKVFMDGNVFLHGAQPCKHEPNAIVRADFDPQVQFSGSDGRWLLYLDLEKSWVGEHQRKLITSQSLGLTATLRLPFEGIDCRPFLFNTDFFGRQRNLVNPFPGPFERPEGGRQAFTLWLASNE